MIFPIARGSAPAELSAGGEWLCPPGFDYKSPDLDCNVECFGPIEGAQRMMAAVAAAGIQCGPRPVQTTAGTVLQSTLGPPTKLAATPPPERYVSALPTTRNIITAGQPIPPPISIERPMPTIRRQPSSLPALAGCGIENWINDHKLIAAALVVGLAFAMRGAK
jgi:hypothetical protein